MLIVAIVGSSWESSRGLEQSKTLRADVGRRTSRQRLGLR
jgi:hypothetical protein